MDKDIGCILIPILIVFIIILVLIHQVPNAITVNEAKERFESISGSSSVEIVRHSNNMLFVGETHDVTFELLVDGKPMTGRCTSGIFSSMVCRLYSIGVE